MVFLSICDPVPHPPSSSHVHTHMVLTCDPGWGPMSSGKGRLSWRKHQEAWRAQVVKSGLPHPELSLVFSHVT